MNSPAGAFLAARAYYRKSF